MKTFVRPVQFVSVCILLTAVACAGRTPSGDSLEQARILLSQRDLAESFDRAMELLDVLIRETRQSSPSTPGPSEDSDKLSAALMLKGEAQLELLLAALLTGDAGHFAHLQQTLGWELEGALTDPRNLQILSQEIMEGFRQVERRETRGTPRHTQAVLLADLCMGLQGLSYRDRQHYLAVMDQIESSASHGWVASLLALHDLHREVISLTGAARSNWQRVDLGVLVRVCPLAATKHVATVCRHWVPTTEAEEYCPTDLGALSESASQMGRELLRQECSATTSVPGREAVSRRGMEAVRYYYEGQLARSLASRSQLPTPLAEWVESMIPKVEEALQVLERDLF
jgi:hypothetical protein